MTDPSCKDIAPMWGGKRFRREHRLLKHDVLNLLSDGARLSRADLAIKLSESLRSGGRIAISVPKRILKRAVDRNIVKRVIREEFRQSPMRALPVDLLVTLRSATSVRPGAHAMDKHVRKQLQSTLKQLFNDVSRRFGG